MPRLGRLLSLVVVLSILAAGCSKSSGGGASPSGSGGPSKTITIGSDTANDHGAATVTGKSTLDMEQDNFYFGPTVLTGTAGQSLTIHLTNNGTVNHTFTSDALGIDQQLSPGQSMDIKVTFPTTGFTEFYCRFHRASGMVGELTVS